MMSYFHRRHEKKIDLKDPLFQLYLSSKHLVEKLDLVIHWVETLKLKKKAL